MGSVLEGIKVLELCEVYQGPIAGQILGDFGANVIKVERPQRGDSLRHSDTVATAKGKMGSYFAAANRNKQSISLDLKQEEDKQLLLKMVAEADVLMHNYRPGVMQRLGLDYELLKKINPKLIYAAASGFGVKGPFANMAGQDLLIQSVSGLSWKTTADLDSPVFVNVPISDYTSGVLLVQGILLALFERQRSGTGQEVNVDLLSTLVSMQGLEAATILNYDYETKWSERALNFSALTKDGWINVVGFFRENPLQLLCQALDVEDLSKQSQWDSKDKQAKQRDQIARALAPAFKKFSRDECVQRLQQAGVLAAPVFTLQDILEHQQIRDNKMLTEIPVAGQEPMRVVANPVKLSRTPARVYSGPPQFDADAVEIKKKYSDR